MTQPIVWPIAWEWCGVAAGDWPDWRTKQLAGPEALELPTN